MEKSKLIIKTLDIQPAEDSFLYRFMTIEKLLDFLFNNRIPLLRLDILQDKLEGAAVEHLLLNLGSNKIGEEIAPWFGKLIKEVALNINPINRNSLRRGREIFQKTNYANCWYASNHESIAMWQIYSNPNSVSVRIPYKALIAIFHNQEYELPGYDHQSLKLGSVRYYRFNDLDQLSEAVVKNDIQGFLKDYSFQHEQEFRIMLEIKSHEPKNAKQKEKVLDEQKHKNNLNDLKVLYLTLSNFNTLPFEIIFHPESLKWHRKNVEGLLKKYDLPFQTRESGLKDIFF